MFALVSLWALLSVFFVPALVFAQDSTAQDDDQKDDLKDDIEKYEKKLKEATKKKAALEQNLHAVSASLGAAILAVRKTQAAILDTKDSIVRKELEIELASREIALKQAILADLVREAYLGSAWSSPGFLLGEKTLSETVDASDPFTAIGSRIEGILNDVEEARLDQEREKSKLEKLKAESEAALAKKNAEKASLAQNQAAIAEDVAEHEATIEDLQKKLAELESDLNAITGKSYNAKDIREAVEFASDKTGVPKGVLYGFLKMETNLGVNTGQCTYQEVEKGAVARYKSLLKKIKSGKRRSTRSIAARKFSILLLTTSATERTRKFPVIRKDISGREVRWECRSLWRKFGSHTKRTFVPKRGTAHRIRGT
ncbi:MAG: hypothetical protein IPL87_02200 [Candidatus Moraniibacteriota bacterium]|nr:MAG: hypothetical protein IPL87_02200 [Candidatus Moranbacteria bacterium]